MPDLLGHLEIGSECCGLTELVSSCRAMGLIKQAGGCSKYWKVKDCDDCCCAPLDPGGDITDTPWYDPLIPQSREFLGLYGSLNLASPANQTTVSASGSTTAAVPKQLTFVGAIVASSQAGVAFGEQWVEKTLIPECPSCDGVSVRYHTFCNDTIVADPPETEQVVPDPYVGWDDPCNPGDPERLLPADVPTLIDSGQRDLLRVRYNAGSYTALNEDPSQAIPVCAGKRITFSFTVLESYQYLEPVDACTIEGDEIDCCYCVPTTWEAPAEIEQDATQPWCNDAAAITTEDRTAPSTPAETACQWSMPLSTWRHSCLTPYVAGDSADLVVTIGGGDIDAYNVAITFWEAQPGWPSPTHPVGRVVYRNETATGRAHIQQLKAGSTVTLDGRTSTGTEGVSGCSGIFRQPKQACARRTWVSVDFDCLNPPGDGWSMSVTVHPRERIVG